MNKSALLNRDRLMNANSAAVQNRMVLLFDRIQLYRDRERNLLALACAFILLCSALKANPQDVFTAAKNLMVDPLRPEGIRHGFAAMEHHLKEDYIEGGRS